jgi:3'-phosphoadenosine 5'-phosphosulfate sulfotransferase (PAPS reductase)/FAD synthetase
MTPQKLTHLQRLEAESVHIIREVAAECENPVMLYSIGKDSAVMLHLAMKAFYPSKPPFPLMHVDTTWKFRDMITFRDQTVAKLGLNLIVHTNPDGLAKKINPFDHGSALHTQIMKTDALKQALDKYGFDAAFGGARRDEEKSRAKERPVVMRDGQMIMVDDDRMPLHKGERPETKLIRFRTLGCYPLTGAIESNAASLLDIIQEMLVTTSSERQGRVIDKDQAASMEKKKQEGYF